MAENDAMAADVTAIEEQETAYDWSADFWLAKPAYSEEFAGEVTKRWEAHFAWVEKSGLVTRWAKSYRTYHGMRNDGTMSTIEISFAGEQGEFADLEANQYRTLVKHVLNLGTSGRPSFDARATNGDSKSAKQVKLARDAIEYYQRDQGNERKLKLVAETALVFGEAFLHQYWDQHEGPDSQMGGRAGDVRHHVLTPLDVAHERGRDLVDANWWIVRDWQSRYDLAATYPDLAEDIIGVDGREDFATLSRWRVGALDDDESDDKVPVFWFYHRRTSAAPDGRHAILVGDVVVYDGPLPYESCPVYGMQPSTFLGTDVGYADAWDILGLHSLHSGILSALTTRADSFAVPTVVTGPEGVSVQDLRGMRLVKILQKAGLEPIKPELLDLFSVRPELYQLLEMSSGMMSSGLGINSVISGGDQKGVTSGAHAALLQAMAIQFNSGFQASWAFLLEAFANGIVRLLKRFVQEERLLELSGVQGRWSVEAFRGSDLEGISRVTIDLGNPMSRTAAGRHQIASELLERGMIRSPEQYLDAISTGRLDPLFDGPTSQIESTKAENEALSKGGFVPVHVFERHDLHIQEHVVLINEPESKSDPQLVQAVDAHLQEHLRIWTELSATSPHLLAATGTPPLPLPGMGAPPVPGPGGAPTPDSGGKPKQQTDGQPRERAAVDTPLGAPSDLPAMPGMPVDPASGEQAAEPGGF